MLKISVTRKISVAKENLEKRKKKEKSVTKRKSRKRKRQRKDNAWQQEDKEMTQKGTTEKKNRK